MIPRPLAIAAALGAVFWIAATAAADNDLSFVSDEELTREIAAREADLERTRGRLERIEFEREAALEDLAVARRSIGELESSLSARVALLYRISRQGAGLRCLLGRGAGAGSLKHIAMLKRLVRRGLEQRRAFGLRLAEIEDRLEATAEELRGARELELRLEAAREELLDERRRRSPHHLELALLAARRQE